MKFKEQEDWGLEGMETGGVPVIHSSSVVPKNAGG